MSSFKQAMSWLEWAASGDDQYVVINAEIERLREGREYDRAQRLLLGAEIELQRKRIEEMEETDRKLRHELCDLREGHRITDEKMVKIKELQERNEELEKELCLKGWVVRDE